MEQTIPSSMAERTDLRAKAVRRFERELAVPRSDKPRVLSAQRYAQLSQEEKAALEEALNGRGMSLSEYEQKVKKLSPPTRVLPQPHYI